MCYVHIIHKRVCAREQRSNMFSRRAVHSLPQGLRIEVQYFYASCIHTCIHAYKCVYNAPIALLFLAGSQLHAQMDVQNFIHTSYMNVCMYVCTHRSNVFLGRPVHSLPRGLRMDVQYSAAIPSRQRLAGRDWYAWRHCKSCVCMWPSIFYVFLKHYLYMWCNIHIRTYLHTGIWYLHTCLHKYIHTWLYVHMFASMCVNTHTHTHMYTYTVRWGI